MEKDSSSLLKKIKALLNKSPEDTLQEILEFLADMKEKRIIDKDLEEMIQNILTLKDTSVREIMVPKVDMTILESTASINDLIKIINKRGYSKIPLYENTPDNIIGIVYAKDLLKHWRTSPDKINIKNLMRPPLFVPEGKKIKELLNEFKKKKSSIAIVIDEYGNVDGLLTLTDIIAEIVGSLPDEGGNSDDQQPIIDQGNGMYLVDPKITIDEFNQAFSVNIPEDNNYDTIGGFITYKMQKIPKFGETLGYQGLGIKIARADKKRILRITVKTKLGKTA